MENTYPEETNPWNKRNNTVKFQYFRHLEPKRMKPLREHSIFAQLLFVGILVAAIGLVFLIYLSF